MFNCSLQGLVCLCCLCFLKQPILRNILINLQKVVFHAEVETTENYFIVSLGIQLKIVSELIFTYKHSITKQISFTMLTMLSSRKILILYQESAVAKSLLFITQNTEHFSLRLTFQVNMGITAIE